MAFQRPTLSALVDRVKGDLKASLPTTDPFLRRSVLGILARMLAGATHGLYGYISWLTRQILPDTADADNLDRHANLWGLGRKEPTYAVGSAIFTGIDGKTIPAGSIAQAADGTEVSFDADAVIAGGTVTAAVMAVVAGADGNLPANSALTLSQPIEGIESAGAVDANGLSGGVDTETDDELRDRILTRLRKQPQGGSADDYISWAKEIAGVTRAWCYPEELGAGTVTVRFVMDDLVGGPIPDAGIVTEVADYIATVRPVTADVTVVAPVADALDMTIKLSPNTADVQAAVTAELTDLLLRESEPGGTILLSHLNEAVSAATDEADHQITIPAADVVSATGHMAVIGVITFEAL